jgi:hypothetical protein
VKKIIVTVLLILVLTGIATASLRAFPVKADGLPGDVDGDGDVDGRDIVLIASHWSPAEGSPKYDPLYDLSDPKDGKIDGKDLAIVAANFGMKL